LSEEGSNSDVEDAGDIMPTGYVVGIISRNWKEYVATFAEDEVHFVMIYFLS
jgi:hypothetical protein